MSTPKKTHDIIRQNEHVVKKSQKHDTNLQKNSIFYFQVGLVVSLLAAYGLFEMKFQYEIQKVVHRVEPDNPNDFVIDVLYKPETPKESEPINDKKIVNKFLPPEIVPDEVPILPFDVPMPTA